MASSSLSTTVAQLALSGRNLQASLPVILGPLLDNAKIGALGVVCVARVIEEADTTLPHQLGRVPNGYIQYRAPNGGGQITDATTGITGWTYDSIKLAATVAGTYSFILL